MFIAWTPELKLLVMDLACQQSQRSLRELLDLSTIESDVIRAAAAMLSLAATPLSSPAKPLLWPSTPPACGSPRWATVSTSGSRRASSGANAHYVRFEKGGLQKLELKKIPANQWNVLSEEQVKDAIDGQLVAASRKKGNDAAIGRLLSQGANKDAVDRQGCPAVWHAADRGHCGNLRQLVMNGADVEARTRAGQTPLMCACFNGHNEVVEFLLQSGAEVNAEKQGGNTALMAAAAQGHATCVEMLLRHGANANAATADGWTALIASANCREPTEFYCARHC